MEGAEEMLDSGWKSQWNLSKDNKKKQLSCGKSYTNLNIRNVFNNLFIDILLVTPSGLEVLSPCSLFFFCLSH